MQWPRTKVAWVYKAIACIQLNNDPYMGITRGLDIGDRLIIIQGINIVGITVLVSWVCEAIVCMQVNMTHAWALHLVQIGGGLLFEVSILCKYRY